MQRLHCIDFHWQESGGNSFLTFPDSELEKYSLKRGSVLGSHYSSLFERAGALSLSSDGLLGVVAEDAPAPESTVVLFQEISGVYVEVGRQKSSDGSWGFKTLGQGPTLAVALKQGYNAGIVSGLFPGIADE